MAVQKQEKETVLMVPTAGGESLRMATSDNIQVGLIFARTPEQFIKQRKGRGSKTFDYVETNYVIARLNATFLCDWDLDIIEERIFKEISQIATKVKLTVRFLSGKVVSKTAWGGSAIKTTQSGEIIDMADDLKSAESDALKKAASMIGICWDVYSGAVNGDKADTIDAEDEAESIDENEDLGFEDDPRKQGEEDEKETKEKEAIASWIKLYLEKKTIDYKDFKAFLQETPWKPKRAFVGKQFGNLSLTAGKLEDLRYLKQNIDKCIDKYLSKRMKKNGQD